MDTEDNEMMRPSWSENVTATLLALTLALLLAGGCGDDGAENQDPDGGGNTPDSTAATAAPKVSFSDLKAYTAVKGTATVKVKVEGTATKLELLVDGKVAATVDKAPWSISWDTSKMQDGLCKLSLKGYAGSKSGSSEQLPVVVLNKGAKINWKDGDKGKIIVPKSGYVDQHLKYHWDMPTGVTQIIVLLGWDNSTNVYELELALGKGTCPDSGTTAVRKQSKDSPLPVPYPDKVAGNLGTGQWFAHVQLMNSTKVLGTETPFTLTGYLIK